MRLDHPEVEQYHVVVSLAVLPLAFAIDAGCDCVSRSSHSSAAVLPTSLMRWQSGCSAAPSNVSW